MPFFGKPPPLVRIEANLIWKVALDAQAQVYVGTCEPLNLNAMGNTWAEFQECANEAIGLLLADLFEDNELEGFMRQNGWALLSEMPPPGRTPQFDVPFGTDLTELRELIMADA